MRANVSDVEEVLFVRGLNPGSYGCNEANLEIAKKTLEEFRKGGKVTYVSNAIFVAMKTIDWEISKLENILIFVFGKEYKFVPMWQVVKDFKKWKDEYFPGVKKITLIVAPPVRDEHRLEFKKAFQLKSDILIFSAELPEKEDGFWSSEESTKKHAELEKEWKFKEWWRKKLPKNLYERVFPQ